MKNFLIGLLAFLGSLFVAYGCSSISQNMSVGQRLYSSKCSSCHILIEPEAFDEETWNEYVNKYGQKMTDEEKELLMNYLTESKDNCDTMKHTGENMVYSVLDIKGK
jgi:hypothetical protein